MIMKRLSLLPLLVTLFGCRAGSAGVSAIQAQAVPPPVRSDGRLDNVAIQKAVKAIDPSNVKEICFVLNGEFPQPLPPITGPVKSQKEITAILGAFSGSTRLAKLDELGVAVEHEEVWIAQNDGRTLVLDLNGYPDDYAAHYGKEVEQIMEKCHGSSTRAQIEAEGIVQNVYRPQAAGT